MKLLGLTLAGLLAASSAIAGEVLVAEVRGASLKVGQRISDSEPLVLKEGQKVTLIAGSKTIKLSGPWDKPPLAAGGDNEVSLVAALAALQTDNRARLTQAGVIRDGGPAPGELPDPWLVNIDIPGSVCVRDKDQLIFWRNQTSFEETVTLAPTDRTWTARAVWQPGVDRLRVPTILPLKDNAVYQVESGDRKITVKVQIVPATTTSDDEIAAFMVTKNCEAQATAFVQKKKIQ